MTYSLLELLAMAHCIDFNVMHIDEQAYNSEKLKALRDKLTRDIAILIISGTYPNPTEEQIQSTIEALGH